MTGTIESLQEVAPHETITAEAWNALIDAIQALYQELDELQAQRPGWIVASVRAENGDQPGRELAGSEISTVAASAAADVERSYPAQRVRGRYVISNLPPGLYDVRVVPTIASGFAAAIKRGVQVQSGGATVVTMVVPRAEVAGMAPRVPGLFNRGLQQALDLLASQKMALGQVIDAHGQIVPITTTTDEDGTLHYTAPPDFAERPVLSSEPSEGTEVPAGTSINLLISTAGRGQVEPVSVVRVPELFNLPLQQALNTLATTHLVPGIVLDANGQEVTITSVTDPETGQVTYKAPAGFAARRVVSSEPGAQVLVNVNQAVDLGLAAQ